MIPYEEILKYGDISTDSRTASGVFVALKGEKVDGHDYVAQAVANGAKIAIVEHEVNVPAEKQIIVPSSMEALNQLAKYNLSRCHAKIVAVTGSVGKTTTRNLIYHLISSVKSKDKTYVSRKNFNSKIGLPICAALMPTDTDYAVFEMGMGASGDIRHLTDIVAPNISVITKICEAHLQFFDSLWDIAKAKSEIFEMLQECVIIPGDSPYTDFLKDKAHRFGTKNVLTFSKGDAEIAHIDREKDVVYIMANILGEKLEYSINFANAEDSLAAILAAHVATGVSLSSLKDGFSTFYPENNRGGKSYIENIEVIDDTYNACPTSLKAGIKALSHQNGRKILVVGDMLELGKDEILMHANIAATVDKYGVDKVFACGRLSKYLYNNLQESKRGAWGENAHEIASAVLNEIRDGDHVLVKGSHSMHMEYIVDLIKKEKSHVL